MESISKHDLSYLADQFKLARPIMFTGAGFSTGVKNISGTSVPSYSEVRQKLWDMCFPGETLNAESSVQDLYDMALVQRKPILAEYLRNNLTVDSNSVFGWYKDFFELPWKKAYTLNIDDLETSVARNFNLSRNVKSISGTSDKAIPELNPASPGTLSLIHLNGTTEDIPENTTFSTTQYASRFSKLDPWYANLVNELLVFPVVFIGTKLNEPPLWNHLELRKKSTGGGEYRARSFLVTKNLDPAKKAFIQTLNLIKIK